jgi:hypothetical protein
VLLGGHQAQTPVAGQATRAQHVDSCTATGSQGTAKFRQSMGKVVLSSVPSPGHPSLPLLREIELPTRAPLTEVAEPVSFIRPVLNSPQHTPGEGPARA